MADDLRVLILGGTAEARALACDAAQLPGIRIIYSLAGRTAAPLLPNAEIRSGGFGGAEGLATYLRDTEIGRLVDATHPFASTMSRNAAAACDATGVPRLILHRPPWTRRDGDDWREVADCAAAATILPQGPARVFLSLGRQHLAPFARRKDLQFVVRVAEPRLAPPPLDGARVLVGRGPFDAAGELRLLRKHEIAWLVTRNSGGDATYGKIQAARERGLPVVMICRPDPPPGDAVTTVGAALDWIAKAS